MGSERIFVVGTGRCGTTMFRKLLTRHPQVHVPRETHWIPILWHAFGERAVPADEHLTLLRQVFMAKGKTPLQRIAKDFDLDEDAFCARWRDALPAENVTLRQLMDAFYTLVGELSGCPIVGDKTPDYGLCMGMLRTIWPGARFVHIRRDGRDVAMSMSRVLSFRLLAAWGINHWWAVAYRQQYAPRLDEAHADQPIERFYDLWRSRLERIRDEATRLPAGSYHELAYEDLLADPAAALRDVGRFLDLPDAEAWSESAATDVRRDNTGKNRDSPQYEILTRRFGDELAQLGYRV